MQDHAKATNNKTQEMAISALTLTLTLTTTPNLNARCDIRAKPVSKTLCSNDKECRGTTKKKWEMGVVVFGALATSVVAISPLEAEATRIEYYASVGEPLCDLSFVKSGLGSGSGSGQQASYGDLINVHYTARFADGTVFYSSYKRGRPLTMRVGVGKQCHQNKCYAGGKRKLQIPPHLAYGPEPAGCFSGDCNIPSNATLLYDINFVGVYSGNRK